MLSFVSGIFIQLDTLPNFLQEVGRLFPLYHLAQGLQSTVAMDPSGIGLSGGDVAALLIWGLGANLDRLQELQVGAAGPLSRVAGVSKITDSDISD